MKKVFVLVAVAAMVVACNKPAQKADAAVDTVAVEVVEETVAVVDSAAAATADSVAVAQ